jgi:integrase
MRGKGEGSVFEQKRLRKDGTIYSRWCAEITMDIDETYETKKPKRFYANTRQEVIDWKNKILADKQKGLVPNTNTNSIDQYYQHWIVLKTPPRIKIRTYESYQQMYRLHIKPLLGNIKIQKLTTAQLNLFFNQLLKTLSPASVIRVKAILSSMINTAITENILSVNPVHNTQTIKKDITYEIQVFSEEQIDLLLSTAKSLQYAKGPGQKYTYHAILLALATGARLGELMGLSWDSIDTENHTLTIKSTVVEIKGGLQFDTPKSKASNRTISVAPSVLDEIFKRKEVSTESDVSPLVFHTNTGKPVSPRNISRTFRGLLRKCNLVGFRFHDLRHTHATQLLCNGVDISEVARRLGHDNPAVTLNVYAHFMPKRDKEAASIMGNMLIKDNQNKVTNDAVDPKLLYFFILLSICCRSSDIAKA